MRAQRSIRGQLGQLMALSIGLVVAGGIAALAQGELLAGYLRSVLEAETAIQHATDADLMREAMRADVYAALAATSPDAVRAADESVRIHAMLLRTNLQSVTGDATVDAAIAQLGPRVEEFVRESSAATRLAATDRDAATARVAEVERTFSASADLSAQLRARLVEHGEAVSREASWIALASRIGVFVGVSLVVLAFLYGSTRTRASIVRSISEMAGVLESVCAGRFDVDPGRPVEEFGDFATHVARIREVMRQATSTTHSLGSASAQMRDASDRMASSASEAASQVATVSSAAGSVSKSVTDVSSAVTELNASIKEISRSVSSAASIAASAVEQAEATDVAVNKLSESTAGIDGVVKAITSIAEQTNLLALNATIEAARAGDAGKGFAVVANEVKELARETGKATEDIRRRIVAIQEDSQQAVSAIARIREIIHEINQHQSTIASAVEEQSVVTVDIHRNLTEAAENSGDIARNIEHVASLVENTSSGLGTVRHGVGTLDGLAHELSRVMDNGPAYDAGPAANSAPTRYARSA